MEGFDAVHDDLPPAQHLPADVVLLEMAEVGAKRAVSLTIVQVSILSLMAGAFIAVGALFSTLIATGTTNQGLQRLLEGMGFSVGFFLVVLTGALLFTEVNVEMPATLLGGDARSLAVNVAKLWLLAAVGNFVGAWLVGQAVNAAQEYPLAYHELLEEVVDSKMRYREVGGADGWSRAVLSGVLGNWLVGMAAFLAVMGRSIIGKFIPVLLVVTAFVAAGFMHSPANMGFFSLIQPTGSGPGWGPAFAWSILPAAVGNILGAIFLVALPLWYGLTRRSRQGPDGP